MTNTTFRRSTMRWITGWNESCQRRLKLCAAAAHPYESCIVQSYDDASRVTLVGRK